jgi:hypothetical protein
MSSQISASKYPRFPKDIMIKEISKNIELEKPTREERTERKEGKDNTEDMNIER